MVLDPKARPAPVGVRGMLSAGILLAAALTNHGRCLLAMKSFEEAESSLLRAFDAASTARRGTTEVSDLLRRLYKQWEKPELAKNWETPASIRR